MTCALGILGGTFDPIHDGHLDLGRAAQDALGLTELLIVPANIPPHRPQPIASAFHRFAMVSLAVAGLEGWRASDLELVAAARSFTTDTLAELRQRGYAPLELFFVIGADAFAEIESWKDYPAILTRAHFVVVSRPGFAADALGRRLPLLAPRMMRQPFKGASQSGPMIYLIEAPTANVSSTAIRQRRAEGQSIAGLVPPMVQQHIEQHRLYAAPRPDSHRLGAGSAQSADRLHGQD
jgi:nicotinate-nucleotide adenylyltransferase